MITISGTPTIQYEEIDSHIHAFWLQIYKNYMHSDYKFVKTIQIVQYDKNLKTTYCKPIYCLIIMKWK